MPGTIIAMGRLNRPAIMLYGGTIKPGHSHGKPLDMSRRSRAMASSSRTRSAKNSARTSSSTHALALAPVWHVYANTMATAIERWYESALQFLGARVDPGKIAECHAAGVAMRKLLELDLKPRDIMTRAAFENRW